MPEKQIQSSYTSDQLKLKNFILKVGEWVNYFWGYKWFILITGMLGSATGFVYAKYFTQPTYTAVVSFTMEQKGGVSSLGGLASSLGIGDIGASNTSSMFGGENILYLMKSNRIIHQCLLKPLAELKGDHLLNAYLKNNFEKQLKEKKIMLFPKVLDNINFNRSQDSLLKQVAENIRENQLIAERTDKRNTIITVEVKDGNELWSFLFSKMLVKNTIDLYMNFKVGKLIATEQDLSRKKDSIRGILYGSINTLAFETDLNSHTPLMRYKTNQAKQQIDVDVLKSIYANTIQNLELVKFQRSQEEPIIEIIDEPILPLSRVKLGNVKAMFVGSFLAGFLVIGWLVFTRILKTALK